MIISSCLYQSCINHVPVMENESSVLSFFLGSRLMFQVSMPSPSGFTSGFVFMRSTMMLSSLETGIWSFTTMLDEVFRVFSISMA
jgi:hypothetical protein